MEQAVSELICRCAHKSLASLVMADCCAKCSGTRQRTAPIRQLSAAFSDASLVIFQSLWKCPSNIGLWCRESLSRMATTPHFCWTLTICDPCLPSNTSAGFKRSHGSVTLDFCFVRKCDHQRYLTLLGLKIRQQGCLTSNLDCLRLSTLQLVANSLEHFSWSWAQSG